MRSRRFWPFLRAVLVISGLAMCAMGSATWTTTAEACVNVTKQDLDESVRNLKIANDALEVNDLSKAARWLEAARRFLNDAKHAIDPTDGKVHGPGGSVMDPPDAGLYRRAARIRALIRSRTPKATLAEREEALKMFETEVLVADPDPSVLADHAEIMSRVPAKAGLATMILRALREKDLIGSAQAYAALATLEKEAGDTKAESAARDRCKAIARKPTVCA